MFLYTGFKWIFPWLRLHPITPSMVAEPLYTLPGNNTNIIGLNKIRHCPMRDYSCLRNWSLPTCVLPTEWVKVKSMHMVEFVVQGKVHLESGLGICELLVDDNELGGEDSINPTNLVMLLGDMVVQLKFLHKTDFHRWGRRPSIFDIHTGCKTIYSGLGMCWRRPGIYKVVRVSQFNMLMSDELLKLRQGGILTPMLSTLVMGSWGFLCGILFALLTFQSSGRRMTSFP